MYLYECTYVNVRTCVYVYVLMHMYVDTFTYICVHIYMYINLSNVPYISAHFYVYICKSKYIHTLGMGVPTGIEPSSPAFWAGMGMLMGIEQATLYLYIHALENYGEVHLVLVFS